MRSQACFKSVIQSGRSLFLSKIKNTSLKLPCYSHLARSTSLFLICIVKAADIHVHEHVGISTHVSCLP
jgi:hypothetical protein